METHYASPERSDKDEVDRQVEFVTQNSVIDNILHMVGGLIAVLNQNRQILAVNHQLLKSLGVENPDDVLGLRPGEALGCRYSAETTAGCGTGPHCVTCGAVIAIVTALKTDASVDKTCYISLDKNGENTDLFFRVHTSTIKIDSERFVLIFMHDITQNQRQAALERTFFHDINNTIMGLLSASELLAFASPGEVRDLGRYIVRLTKRLSNEVAFQKHLSEEETDDLEIQREAMTVDFILEEIEKTVPHHLSGTVITKRLKIRNEAAGALIQSDPSLLMRVLQNMLINAFEASSEDDEIRLTVRSDDANVIFSVWNRGFIKPSIGRRIFQRNFSTKEELGRGLGTYSMKLIGEQFLGGRVYFESSKDEGTRFYLVLPLNGKTNGNGKKAGL